MKKTILLIFAFFCLSTNALDFPFYVYASNWAPSICALEPCYQYGADEFWNIHGLWPSDGSMGLGYCTDELFDVNQVKDLEEELALYWNGMYSPSVSYHAHEWARHGTCGDMDIKSYFSLSLDIAHNLDLYGSLYENGIIPGDEYECEEISKALTQAYKVNKFSISSKDGYITQIMLCVDRQHVPIDCPFTSNCQGMLKYPKRK